MSDASPQEVTFLIIGAGFSGLGAAIRLTRAGHRDLVVLERAGDVGGTWGRNLTLWPGFTFDFRRRTRTFRTADFVLSANIPEGNGPG